MNILSLLEELQSSDNIIRNNAEDQLSSLQLTRPEDLVLALLGVPSQDQSQHTQLAITLLRRVVVQHWGVAFSEFTGQSILSPATKQIVRDRLLRLLISPSNCQPAIAYTLSTIGGVEYPDEWPTLMTDLLATIRSEDSDNVAKRGCLLVIKELVEEGLSAAQFFKIGTDLLGALFSIVELMVASSPDSASALVSSNAVLALDTFIGTIEFFPMVDDDATKQALKPVIKRVVAQWCDLLRRQFVTNPPQSWELRISAVRAIESLRTGFPKAISHEVPTLFTAIWHSINTLDIPSIEEDDMATTAVYESLTMLEQMMDSSRITKLFETTPTALGDMLTALVPIAAWPDSVYTVLESDMNQFVTTESEFAFGNCNLDDGVSNASMVRMSAQGLLDRLSASYSTKVVTRMITMVQSLLESGSEVNRLESALFLLEKSLLAEVVNDTDYANVPRLMEIIRLALQHQSPLIQGRGFLLSSSLAFSGLCENSPDIQTQCLALLIQGIDVKLSYSTQMAILIAIKRLTPILTSLMIPHQLLIINYMDQFVRFTHPEDDTPVTFMEILNNIIELDPAQALQSRLTIPLIFNIAAGDLADTMVGCYIQSSFQELTRAAIKLAGGYNLLCQRTLPHVFGAIQVSLQQQGGGLEYTPELSVALDILTVVLNQEGDPNEEEATTNTIPMPVDQFNAVFQMLGQVLLSTVDNDILQGGAMALAATVRTNSSSIDASGRELVLRVVEKLLDPSLDESAAMSAGALVSVVVETFGNHLGEYLPKILQVTAYRITSAKTPMFIENLLNVFCRLTLLSAHDVVDFLDTPEVGALKDVVKAWLANFAIFTKYKEIINNITALAKIYCLQDPRIDAIIVDGDIIPRDNDLIITRSMAKSMPEQYTQISASLKIIKLFIHELDQCEVTPKVPGLASKFGDDNDNDNDFEDDEDDFEDELYDNGEGWEDINFTNHDSLKELLALGDEEDSPRETDSETYNILVAFFKEVINGDIGNFKYLYEQGLSAREKDILVRVLG